MPDVGEWIHFDLRCYGCDADLWLSEFESVYYCSPDCVQHLPLSGELVGAFSAVLVELGVEWYLDWVGGLPVADAMLEPHPQRGSGRSGHMPKRDQPDGLQSHQWRHVRLQQLESLVTPQ